MLVRVEAVAVCCVVAEVVADVGVLVGVTSGDAVFVVVFCDGSSCCSSSSEESESQSVEPSESVSSAKNCECLFKDRCDSGGMFG